MKTLNKQMIKFIVGGYASSPDLPKRSQAISQPSIIPNLLVKPRD
ncbi:hypothetical protein [Pseudoalteromonas luteoviolacea]|uniref:Uncharacterized protein n=1 Tax=Pseudoalteromonas luteoviolacea S4060-1 TaxID=1365257 RepID=A0A162BSX4_9GAMM|nr:hypothetical protein [Pseudoalteromonas luteoviolacea]KZN67901.1 hypothetical protein N478_16895 [Pseudoalteromonas luteoviolacea S4060-1]